MLWLIHKTLIALARTSVDSSANQRVKQGSINTNFYTYFVYGYVNLKIHWLNNSPVTYP